MEKRFFKYDGPFHLEGKETLSGITICYHISKEFTESPDKGKKVIWITHALTANSNPCEWWSDLVGEGKFLDPRRYTIVCANILGSCYGSTSPLSVNPQTGKPYMLSFPKLTIRDIVNSLELLRKALKIEKIDMLIGGSVGGFQAIEWSIMKPGKIAELVLLASNGRVTPWNCAFNESQKMALYADSTFTKAKYKVTKGANGEVITTTAGAKGLATARSIALISYRSYTGYNISQEDKDNATEDIWHHRVNSYQRYQGEKLVKRFDAYSYLSMLQLFESHDIGRGRGGVAKALEEIEAKVTTIGIDSDGLFPPSEQKLIAERAKRGSFHLIHSLFGHDGFLLEWRQIQDILNGILDNKK